LLYYHFSYPLGGGDLLPLAFAEELQDVSRVTMAVDSLPGFRRASDAFGIRLDPARVSVVPCSQTATPPKATPFGIPSSGMSV
jgi:hypothetical protein